MKVITVATAKSGYYYALEETAQKYGYELVLLGLDQKWKGFGWRIKLVLEYLKTLPGDEIFMMVDAYDVILLRDAFEAKVEFTNMNVPFLCGGFRKVDGIIGVIQEHEFGSSTGIKSPYNNICAGTWMSRVKTTLDLWKDCEITDTLDDQRLLNTMFRIHQNIISPDYQFKIFATLFPSLITLEKDSYDEIEIIDNKLYSHKTRTYPFVLHGLANMNLSGILQELNIENIEDLTPYSYKINKMVYHIKTAWEHSWIVKLIVFLIVYPIYLFLKNIILLLTKE